MTRVGFLYTRLRVEEKHLLDEFEKTPRCGNPPHQCQGFILRYQSTPPTSGCALQNQKWNDHQRD